MTDTTSAGLLEWDKLDNKITEKNSALKTYKRDIIVPTLEKKFQKSVRSLTDLILEEKKKMKDDHNTFLSLIVFFKEHPSINQIVFKHAITRTIFKDDFTSHSVLNPIQVREEKES